MNSLFFSRCKRAAVLIVSPLAVVTAAVAAPITTNFSNYAGLAYGGGTNQTISQDGIRLQALQGKYEVTYYPEVNLKDFGGTGATREIQLDLVSGDNFDFEAFSIRDLSGSMTLTSSGGGSSTVSGFTSPTFSGSDWENLSWVKFSFTGQYSEAKLTSFTLNDSPTVTGTVPEPSALALAGLALALGAGVRLRAAQGRRQS